MSTFTIGKDGTIVSTEEKQCPYCGRKVMADATFCTYCGERIGSKKCPHCGKTAEADAKFCSECGTRLDGGAAAQPKKDTHQYVDLGLPSGTLWATCNVGATNPEDAGDYFAWGETAYWKDKYKYCIDEDDKKLTKYCSKSSYGNNGFTDSRTKLEKSDDAATANWGEDWCMPTLDQIKELIDKCTWNWTSRNGKNGYEVIGQNGNRLFLPAAGSRSFMDDLEDVGSDGIYWSRSLDETFPNCAWSLWFESSSVNWVNDFRDRGNSVRPVRSR